MSEPVGIIYPPPELRGIVDSTAKYVAKNGGAFEERIMREHRGKPKFSFLFSEDPFNAYYRHKVKEIRQQILNETNESHQQHQPPPPSQPEQDHRNRQVPDETNSRPDEGYDTSRAQRGSPPPPPPRSSEIGARLDGETRDDEPGSSDRNVRKNEETTDRDEREPGVRPKLDEYMQEISMRLEEPPNLNFSATPASSMTHLESDIMRLTAQYIATYGRSFLLDLAGRERDNIRFDFLQPQHGQFPYLTNLIMQYALIMNAPLDILEQLEKDSTSQRHVLERIKMRAEWNKMLELERKKRDEAKEQEKLLYSQIDWHDFVIVETIDYQPDEVGAYPPTTPDQVGTRLLMQQRTEDNTVPEEMEIDMDME